MLKDMPLLLYIYNYILYKRNRYFAITRSWKSFLDTILITVSSIDFSNHSHCSAAHFIKSTTGAVLYRKQECINRICSGQIVLASIEFYIKATLLGNT